MNRYLVQAGTILDQLARYVQAGNTLKNTSELLAFSNLSPDQQKGIFEAFDELGADYLKPVFDKFNPAVNYNELKILHVCHMGQKG